MTSLAPEDVDATEAVLLMLIDRTLNDDRKPALVTVVAVPTIAKADAELVASNSLVKLSRMASLYCEV